MNYGLAKWIIIVALIAGGGAVWILAAPQFRGPSISWSPEQVLVFVLPNSREIVGLEFRSDQNLSDIEVSLTPSLADVVSTRPDSFRRISSRRDYRVSLDIATPLATGVKYERVPP